MYRLFGFCLALFLLLFINISTLYAASDYDTLTLQGGQPQVISSQCNISENLGSNWEDIINNQSKWVSSYSYLFSLFQDEYKATQANGKGWALLQNKVTYSGVSTGSSRAMDENDTFLTLLVTPVKKNAEFIDNSQYAKHLATKENTWMIRIALTNDCSKGLMVVSASKNSGWDYENQIIAWDNSNSTWLGNLIDIHPVFVNYDINYPIGYEGSLPDTTPLTPPRLDYLALGDSYSSGEGDTEINPKTNKKHYRAWTDNEEDPENDKPREKCHLSTRSYPYKLATGMNLTFDNTKEWDSVACSGAQTYDIDSKNSNNYEGQGRGGRYIFFSNGGEPRLKGYSNKEALKAQALNDFIPGRQKQIEFVKKYKPKAVTLTMGGNNVDFGGRLASCAIYPNSTCDTAKEQGRKDLGKQIKKQFSNLTNLYKEIKIASLGVKVYILGYPQIITDGQNDSCPANTAGLDWDERKVIVAGYWYMNQVIKTAAKKEGVQYIDVSQALNGHRLCENSPSYATGVVAGAFSKDERQESFHPNAVGNSAIANAVWDAVDSQSLVDYTAYPSTGADEDLTEADIPDSAYLQTDNPPASNKEQKSIASDDITRSSSSLVSLQAYSLAPASTATLTLHSNPVSLGSVTADSEGGLSTNITIPNTVPVGYHTLTVSGETYSGEAIEYEQTILVKGENSNDIDDDAIADNVDKCLFVPAANQDADFDGIDDACDPDITDPILYIARNGDTTKGEDPDKLYLYRNTRASSVTGITNDYVDVSQNPDNKEALVGTSLSSQTEGIFNKFVMLEDENNPNIKIPTILMKDTNNICIAIQPTDYLSPALNPSDLNYQPRGFNKLTQLPGGIDCE